MNVFKGLTKILIIYSCCMLCTAQLCAGEVTANGIEVAVKYLKEQGFGCNTIHVIISIANNPEKKPKILAEEIMNFMHIFEVDIKSELPKIVTELDKSRNSIIRTAICWLFGVSINTVNDKDVNAVCKQIRFVAKRLKNINASEGVEKPREF
ncbi:MAG: hypothetical protein LBI37_01590 [Puniceicoccales bacterium]|jgi:hypothetical protein|nr:hypothetical protein [Puniceicoccales bacterium]